MHCYKRPEDVCYDDNYINKSNHHNEQYAIAPSQNQGYGSVYGTTYGNQPQYSHPDTVKFQYYSETTETCYDDQYGIGKPNHGYGTNGQLFGHQKEHGYGTIDQLFGHQKEHGYGTGGQLFGHQKEHGYGTGGQLFGHQKDDKLATHGYNTNHQTGYGSSFGSYGIGCNERSGMKLKGKSHGYKKRNGNGSYSDGSDSD